MVGTNVLCETYGELQNARTRSRATPPPNSTLPAVQRFESPDRQRLDVLRRQHQAVAPGHPIAGFQFMLGRHHLHLGGVVSERSDQPAHLEYLFYTHSGTDTGLQSAPDPC